MADRYIIANIIRTPDGTILRSNHVHDYVEHTDANGETYFNDGGTKYARRSINKIPYEDLSVFNDSPFEVIRQYLLRGTFDENSNRIWKPICELSNNHLDNIITYNNQIGNEGCWYNSMIEREIEYRKSNNIVITDNWKPYEQRYSRS